MTINRGPAFVIPNEDFQRSLVNLNNQIFELKDKYFLKKLAVLENKIRQLE